MNFLQRCLCTGRNIWICRQEPVSARQSFVGRGGVSSRDRAFRRMAVAGRIRDP